MLNKVFQAGKKIYKCSICDAEYKNKKDAGKDCAQSKFVIPLLKEGEQVYYHPTVGCISYHKIIYAHEGDILSDKAVPATVRKLYIMRTSMVHQLKMNSSAIVELEHGILKFAHLDETINLTRIFEYKRLKGHSRHVNLSFKLSEMINDPEFKHIKSELSLFFWALHDFSLERSIKNFL